MNDTLTQAGHLTELTVDRHLDGELQGPALESVERHLEGCEACRQLLEEVRAWGATLDVRPPTTLKTEEEPPPSEPEQRGAVVLQFPSSFTRGVSVGLALAAAALFMVLLPRTSDAPVPGVSGPPSDVYRLRGPTLDWEVRVHDGQRDRRVEPGDVVHPGERVGFRVHAKVDGFLAILGADDTGEAYVAYPTDESRRAVPWAGSKGFRDVDAAMRFDAKPGKERLLALLCTKPVELTPVLKELPRGGALPLGCAKEEITLHKVPAP